MPATTSTEQVDSDKYKNVTVRKKKRQPRIEAEARPSTATEEEMQLQIALGLSPEECKKADEMRKSDGARLQMALEESQKEADRLATTKQGTVSNEQLTQSALDDLSSLGVGELVSGKSDQPSSSGAWNSMGMADPLGVPQSSTPASAHTNDGLFTSSNNDPWATSAAPQPAASNANLFEMDLFLTIHEATGIQLKGQYYCELSPHETCAQTSTREGCGHIIWKESFEFRKIPKVQQFLIFIFRKPYSESAGLALIGYSLITLGGLARDNSNKNWYPILLTHMTREYLEGLGGHCSSGEAPYLKIEARWQPAEILPLRAYSDLLETLKSSYMLLCEILEKLLSEDVATLLVRIMYKQNLATEFLCDLIMKEVEKLDNDHLMFRGNTLATKAMESFMKLVSHDYLESTLSDFIKSVLQCEDPCEVDPQKVGNVSNSALERNRSLLMRYVEVAWTKILNNTHQLPRHLREVFSALRYRLEAQNRGALADTLISSSIFLRFLCPAILSPSFFNLVSEYPSPTNARNLTLIAKTLQNLANFSKFGGKEPHMEFMNEFVDREWLRMKDFLLQISTELKLPSDKGSEAVVDCGKELSLIATYLEEAWTPLLEENNGNELLLTNIKLILSELAEWKRRPENAIFDSPISQQPSSSYHNSPQPNVSFHFSSFRANYSDDGVPNNTPAQPQSEPEEEVADEEEEEEPPLSQEAAKKAKAARERARCAKLRQPAPPSKHQMSTRQRNKQKLLNDFLVIQGLDRSSFKNPSKKDLDQWKTSVFKAIQDQLFETLFQKYCYNTGYMHELSLFKQLKTFRKMRFERRDRKKRVEIAIGFFKNTSKCMHLNEKSAPPRTFNSVFIKTKKRLRVQHIRFIESTIFKDLKKIFK